MSYVVLARKYRPTRFDEVIGQEVVTRVLTGALEDGRLGHAYLFAGPRGTGKTTTARIFAKSLNCERGPTPEPCGECEACLGADSGTAVDIQEIDAASHTGVDDIRELRDEVGYAPMRARYKVYIVDEVHMLSKAAFNALLKTLEEPPAHVVFLFATTEPHKVLDTILSRCQVLKLSALSEEAIIARLDQVFALESVKPEEGVTRELARSARGGMRDALSLADKLLALSGDAPTLADLERLGGDGGGREVRAVFEVIEAADKARLLENLAAFQGSETELVAGLLDHLRHALVVGYCGDDTPLVPGTLEERREAGEFARRIGSERLELWMQELLRARERMRLLAGQERLVLEVTLLDLCRPESSLPLSELVQRLESLESGQPLAPLASTSASSPAPEKRSTKEASSQSERPAQSMGRTDELVPEPRPASASGAEPKQLRDRVELWNSFLEELRGGRAALAELLEQCGKLAEAGAGRYRLALAGLDADGARLFADGRNRRAMERAFQSAAGTGVVLEIDQPSPAPQKKAAPPAPSEPTASSTRAKDEPAAPSRERERSADVEPAPEPSAPSTSRPAPKQDGDAFTQGVADLFGGVIEDLG